MRAFRRLLPVLAVLGCAGTPKSVPTPSVAELIAPRAVKAGPIGPKRIIESPYRRASAGTVPVSASKRYTLDVQARAELADRRATVEWTLKVASLSGEQSVDLYLDAPPGIAIDALWLDVQEGTLSEGRVAPAWSAAAVYEQVTAQRIDPALLERVDDTRFRLRVFPLNRARLVRLRYHAILPATAEGMILQVPRPHLVGEPEAWPNTVRIEVEDARGITHVTDRFALKLPYDAGRAEFAVDGAHRISQWQFVPTQLSVGVRRPVIAAIDTGAESPHVSSRFVAVGCVRGTVEVTPCAESVGSKKPTDAGARPMAMGATDLVTLLNAAAPLARAKTADIGLVTGGHDRWHDLAQIIAALPADVPVHIQAARGANLGLLNRLAEQGGGHLMLQSSNVLRDTKITDLRIEMLEGQAEWLDLPHSHVGGTPIVLTARHFSPIRARLHGRVGAQTFIADLPAVQGAAQQSIVPIWRRAHLETAPEEKAAIDVHLVTRATSLAVFERERDYIAAQTGKPDLAGPPVSSRRQRVVVHHQRVEVRDKIYFKSGSAQIAPASMQIVKAVAELARTYRSLRFAIIGHTDARERHPDALSLRRAVAVHRALLEMAVPAAQMSFLGHAASRPIETNKTSDGRARNRRAEFMVLAFEGDTYARDYRQPSTPMRDVDRIAFVKALLSQRGIQPTRTRVKSVRERLRAVRAQLTEAERLAYFYWVFRPDEVGAEIDRVDIDAVPDWAQHGLIQVLADGKDWARLLPRSKGRLQWLLPAQLVDFLADASHPIDVICQHEMAICAGALHELAAVNPARAQQLAGFALRMPKPPLTALRHARPDDAAIPLALTAMIAHPTVTAADFRRVGQWAATLRRPSIACRAYARANQLSRTQTAPPSVLKCPDAR